MIPCIAFVLCAISGVAQLSPGALVEAHAHLEGISNCTKCHVLGQKVSNDKCLDCHETIRNLMEAGRGYHASGEVRGKDCFTCHSDHHGRRFEIIRFDIDRFDHNLTGYALSGAHRNLDCAQCHRPEYIADAELKRKDETYLGLQTACASCHTDYHQGTLGATCASCHNTDAFRPASGFEHGDTEFPLRGAHANVECIECHAIQVRNGFEFQRFADIQFNQCSSCHDDPHNSRFGVDCKSCHVEESFFALRGQGAFNHNTTGFPLRGQHSRISCADCHDMQRGAGQAFLDFVNADTENCASCHTDVHEGRFGADCRSCHSEESFEQIKGGLEQVDHSVTDFPLEGKHEIVDCRQCHTESLTAPLAFQQCTDCHTDHHEGQFVLANNTVQDCANCHSVDGFEESSFGIERHSESDFPLEGAHLATPCFACHLRDDTWQFRDIGSQCVDCHEDVHAGELDLRYYGGTECTQCHTTDSWRLVAFEHTQTGFALEGAHLGQSCVACHSAESRMPGTGPAFTGLSTECARCHDNVHREQFVQNGVTDCARCHTFVQWKPSTFDHDSARFILEGAHVDVACVSCHSSVSDVQGSYVLYQLDKLDCIDCHQ